MSVFVKLLSRFPNARCECPDIGEDGVDETRLGAALEVEVEGQALDER
jgi:hypothetical protein